MPYANRPGDVLADRYRLVDLLSESGDGRFWRAHDRMLERHVAVHVIRADDARAEVLMAAARRSATVLDPRILRVLDADITDQVCYVVNEWGWGASLDVVATGTGPLGPRRAAWLVSEVADSIATAHRAGVAHGRLNPENVLIDRTGGVRIIGLCVDAALHGVPDIEIADDVTDLAGLLYCALTARWAGQSGSIVTPAPREHDQVLRPRQVRAGIPRPLDSLCEEILHSHPHARHREHEQGAVDARGIADYLADFVGDPAGMAVALLASTPPVLPDEELVVLPQVPDLTPYDTAADRGTHPASSPGATADTPEVDPAGEAASEAGDEAGNEVGDEAGDDVGSDGQATRVRDAASQEPTDEPIGPPEQDDLPTQAGLPIFGPDGDDVSWLERRATPAPPPPPFEKPPERPLFAPEPAGGAPSRHPRPGSAAAFAANPSRLPSGSASARRTGDYWPWETGTGTGLGTGLVDGRGLSSSTVLPVIEDDRVPGRSWFRLGAILSVVVLLVVAVIVAISLRQGPADPPDGNGNPDSTDSIASAPLDSVSATAFDPLGTDGEENGDEAPNAVDGDLSTSWGTQSYNDQLGPPPGLKTGVGLLLDLDGEQEVTSVRVRLIGSPTELSLYLTDEPPTSVSDLSPVASSRAEGTATALRLDQPVTASYAVVWLTALPAEGSLFRGRVAEVVVNSASRP
ncbi:MAG: protein kinase family protein [Nocardioides sp.]